jgi:GMP synthase-like glutamine amidotransferase
VQEQSVVASAPTPPSSLLDQLGWRSTPGILGQYPSSVQSSHALLGYYLKDRTSPTPFPGRDWLVDNRTFDWGIAPPLEKVISGPDELDLLLSHPELFRQSMPIIEPWPSVGTNLHSESVRASKNLAYILQQVADADTVLYPVWESGIGEAERLANVLAGSMAILFEGGDPSVYDASTFDGTKANLQSLLGLTDQILLRRSAGSAPCIFICLAHQLAAASHIRLIKRAVREVFNIDRLTLDPDRHAVNALQRVCHRIFEVGESLPVVKRGEVLAQSWHDTHFAVAPNEAVEVGTRALMPYRRRSTSNHVPGELHYTHELTADELEGVIDTMITFEREIQIEMFHSDEVNEEAALFANWAYKLLHDTIVPIRHTLAVSPLSWLLCLPYAVEILSQTQVDSETMTEVGTTCIYYKDWETRTIRRSFTCQFHPELMADIRDIGRRPGPSYAELKQNDGVRLLIRLLYHGMQE